MVVLHYMLARIYNILSSTPLETISSSVKEFGIIGPTYKQATLQPNNTHFAVFPLLMQKYLTEIELVVYE